MLLRCPGSLVLFTKLILYNGAAMALSACSDGVYASTYITMSKHKHDILEEVHATVHLQKCINDMHAEWMEQ